MKLLSLFLLMIGIWAGFVLGLSFLEAPVKFQAPGISTKLGLGIGRLVFDYSNKIQLIFGSFSLLWIGMNYRHLDKTALFLVLSFLLILLLQAFILLPKLDIRAINYINGQINEASSLHFYFVASEIVKVILLIASFLKLFPK